MAREQPRLVSSPKEPDRADANGRRSASDMQVVLLRRRTSSAAETDGMNPHLPTPTTTPFFIQAALSFGVSLVAVAVGIAYLPVDPWMRAFLALGLLYAITSTFTLAKCVRDQQENSNVLSRVDQARMDKLMADHDPFKVPSL